MAGPIILGKKLYDSFDLRLECKCLPYYHQVNNKRTTTTCIIILQNMVSKVDNREEVVTTILGLSNIVCDGSISLVYLDSIQTFYQ